MNVNSNAVAGIRAALASAESFVAAAQGDTSARCAIFRKGGVFGGNEFTDEQKRVLRLYIDSWVVEPLAAAVASIDGDRSFANEQHLDSIKRGW